jgi:hypothetical protein
MKHHFFCFLLISSFSVCAMESEKNNITKSQVVYSFTNFNNHMKQYYPHAFDTKEFGWFIVGIRSMNTNEFESKREELLKKLESLNRCDPNTNIFDTKELL